MTRDFSFTNCYQTCDLGFSNAYLFAQLKVFCTPYHSLVGKFSREICLRGMQFTAYEKSSFQWTLMRQLALKKYCEQKHLVSIPSLLNSCAMDHKKLELFTMSMLTLQKKPSVVTLMTSGYANGLKITAYCGTFEKIR